MGGVLRHPAVPLYVFTVMLTAVLWAYFFVFRISPSDHFSALTATVWWVLVVIWIKRDARRSQRIPCFEFDQLVFLLLPTSCVWYCLWSRGWRGIGTLLVLAMLWMFPYAVVHVAYSVMYGTV